MQRIVVPLALVALAVGNAATWAQPPGAPPPRSGHGPGPMMPGHGARFDDAAGYLGGLRTALGITPAQQPAWDEYAAVVQGAAQQSQEAHRTMFDAMGTATWPERRDMMNRMFQARLASFDAVHAAAEKLLPALDATQRGKAHASLPGLAGPAHGGMMMGHGMGMGQRSH